MPFWSSVSPSSYSDAEQADYRAAESIYDDFCERAERTPWIAKALDPHYVFVDRNEAPPAVYTAPGSTLQILMKHADGGAAALPIVGGGSPFDLLQQATSTFCIATTL